MRKLLLSLAVACALISTTVHGQTNTTTRFFFTYAKETLTISNTALPFTASKVQSPTIPANSAAFVTFTVNCASGTTCALRFWTDGSTPTSSQGLRAPYGTIVQIYNHTDISNFKAIRETSVDVILDIQYAK